MADVFPNFAETSEQGNIPLHFYSARCVIWQAGVKLTGNDKDIKLGDKLGMENGNFIRCSTASLGGKRYVKSSDTKKLEKRDYKKNFGTTIYQREVFVEYKTRNDTKTIITRDDNEHGYSLECDLE